MSSTYGPTFRWFAWHPVWTEDRGWRWLRFVWRRRWYLDLVDQAAHASWVHVVERPESSGVSA